jgi:outer membrane receptor for ferrienterochelin and colicin
MIGQGQRSDQDFTDFDDSTYNMAGNSNLNPAYFNGYFGYKDLSVRCIGDFYQTSVRDSYDKIKTSGAYPESFNSFFTELKYVLKIDDKLTITPRINFKSQSPWKTPEVDSITPEYNKTARRTTLNLTASYNITRNVNVVFGAERYTDVAVDKAEFSYFSNGDQQVSYTNYAGFAQGLIKTRLVNIILGARYDYHSAYGDAFVPRVGLTKKYKKFHFKALYSNSFRAPAIENINAQTDKGISPEKTQVAELELGYQVTRKSIVTVNFFDITTMNPIVYFYDTTTFTDAYINFGESGTRGAEAEFRIKDKWGYATLNYAFYTASNKEKIADYEVEEDESALLAFANHRLNLNASINLIKGLSVNPSVSLYGPRWAYTSMDSLGNSVVEQLPSTTLLNLFFYYNTPVKGLSVGLGAYDILNQKFKFVQPYNGYHAPLPGPSREYVLRLQYKIPYNKKSD